jgi:hypothetical protein
MRNGQYLNRAIRDAVDDSIVPIDDFSDGLLAQFRDDATGQGKRRKAADASTSCSATNAA